MRCLIADAMHEIIIQKLESAGIDVVYRPTISVDELRSELPGFDGLVVRSKAQVNEALIGDSQLKFVARAGAGVDNLDEDFLNKRGIVVLNAPEGNQNAVADHVVGLLLAMTSKIVQANEQINENKWNREQNRGIELENRTVGLLGYGHMGQQVAKRISAFGCNVIAYDKYKSGFTDTYVREATMEEVWEKAEIFSLHVPLTEDTQQLIDLNYLSKFKHPIWFINTARGKVVHTQELLEAVRQGKVQGAALDVLETEKIDELEGTSWFAQLKASPRVILTPHVAGWSIESYQKISEVLADKIISSFGKN